MVTQTENRVVRTFIT